MSSAELYDETYYEKYLGPIPYSREQPVWGELFGRLADRIVELTGPARVLDVGCAKGFLVEALRDRNVEAFGIDVSPFAISCVREDVRPFCRQGDAAELDDTKYDLIVCLELLEHLDEATGDEVLRRLVRSAPLVLFSSSPDDFDEPTHVNVQPIGYWVERFARLGAWPVPGLDFSEFAPQAMLFKRGPPPDGEALGTVYRDWVERASELARVHDQLSQSSTRLYEAEEALGSLQGDLEAARDRVALVEGTRLYRVLVALRDGTDRVLPPAGRTRRLLGMGLRVARRAAARALKRLPFDPVALEGPERPRLLLVSGCGGDSLRYRGDHLLEALGHLGGTGAVVEYDWPALALWAGRLARACDLIVLQRVPLTQPVGELILAARRHGKPILFETDDLLFDPLEPLEAVPGLSRVVRPGDPALQRHTLLESDAALCATEYLRERIAALDKPVYLLKNGFSAAMRSAAQSCQPEARTNGVVVLGYASGSPTHDGDFAQIAPTLLDLLERNPAVELHLAGPLHVESGFDRFGSRVKRLPYVHWSRLPQRLASFDVNLAPLDIRQPFCLAKSEVKLLEAALVGVPTVASPNPALSDAIQDGVDGFLAGSAAEWSKVLDRLVADGELRAAAGAKARDKVLREYSLERRAEELRGILGSLGAFPPRT